MYKRVAIVFALIASTVLVYAAASYPTSVAVFATRTNGQTIDQSWFNTIQDEIIAIEGGLLNGFAHDLKFTDGLFDIGKSGATRPRDIFLSRNAVVGGTLTVSGNVLSNLTFTDATYDIGASGATRPRDLFLSRNAVVGGDLYTTAWTDYSATSTITGWASFTTKYLSYKKIGKTMLVQFNLAGTSNSVLLTFTLPTAAIAETAVSVTYALDSGTGLTTPPFGTFSSSTADLRKDFAGTAWTNTGTKTVRGSFWYETP